jgi:hypothetical protein
VVILTPPPTGYQAGMGLIVKVANTNTAASVIDVNGLGNESIVHRDGSQVGPGELLSGGLCGVVYDGTNFQLAWTAAAGSTSSGLIFLSAPTAFYVNGTTGSDTLYDGTSATASGAHGPFATIQHALSVMTKYDLSGFTFTIYVADGTYNISSSLILPVPNGSGTVAITGDVSNPQNSVINCAAGSIFRQLYGGTYQISGFTGTVAATVTGDPSGVLDCQSGYMIASNMRFGNCAGCHIAAYTIGNLLMSGTFTIAGSAPIHPYAYESGICNNNLPVSVGVNLVVASAVTFSTAFALATDLGVIRPVYNSISGAANVTGQKYVAQSNGVIETGGAGASYLPGTVAGTTATTGQYI